MDPERPGQRWASDARGRSFLPFAFAQRRVQWAADAGQVAAGDVGVDLSGPRVRVSEQLLDVAEVRALLDQMGREAARVWRRLSGFRLPAPTRARSTTFCTLRAVMWRLGRGPGNSQVPVLRPSQYQSIA